MLAPPHGGLRGGDLLERSAEVDRAGAEALSGAPRDGSVERVIDLEHAGSAAIATKSAPVTGGQPLADDAFEMPRRRVEHVGPRCRHIGHLLDLVTGRDRATQLAQV